MYSYMHLSGGKVKKSGKKLGRMGEEEYSMRAWEERRRG
jgi:hypothetical protein